MKKNPCTGVIIKIDNGILKKDVLSGEEIVKLANTHYAGESSVIRRAFLFSCCTGLRWCDVKELIFANVDFANGKLKFQQAKTEGHSSASGVVIDLTEDTLNLIGAPGEGEDKNSKIFPLPSHTMCLKALRHWVSRAGIDKHITWHCARHSFGTNVLSNGANIKVVATLLGHSTLKHTEKYVRATSAELKEAVNSLPKLNL